MGTKWTKFGELTVKVGHLGNFAMRFFVLRFCSALRSTIILIIIHSIWLALLSDCNDFGVPSAPISDSLSSRRLGPSPIFVWIMYLKTLCANGMFGPKAFRSCECENYNCKYYSKVKYYSFLFSWTYRFLQRLQFDGYTANILLGWKLIIWIDNVQKW